MDRLAIGVGKPRKKEFEEKPSIFGRRFILSPLRYFGAYLGMLNDVQTELHNL
jgi:hypothetical protein